MTTITFCCAKGEHTFEYDNSCTIEEVLKDFLSKTHSKIVLDHHIISFMFKNKILNIDQNLKKKVGEMFKFGINKIKVSEVEPIIGSQGD